ncbi:YdeI/OmpD-associated family protein [Halocola ammonii]
MKKVTNVSEFIEKHSHNQEILVKLREILTATELDETIKWGAPTYTIDGKNVIGMGSFKSYTGLWFFNGVFLKDKSKVLVSADDKTKALRQWRFTSADEIDEKLVKNYVLEAIENQKQGREIKPAKNKPLEIPAELKTALEKDGEAADAFKKLTKSKKREYADHIASAKREATKESRLEKILPMIREGKGLNDKYK